jgi:hypothetical protein
MGDKFTVNVGIYVGEVDELLDDWWRRERKSGVPGRDGAVLESVCWLRETSDALIRTAMSSGGITAIGRPVQVKYDRG